MVEIQDKVLNVDPSGIISEEELQEQNTLRNPLIPSKDPKKKMMLEEKSPRKAFKSMSFLSAARSSLTEKLSP